MVSVQMLCNMDIWKSARRLLKRNEFGVEKIRPALAARPRII